MKKSVYSLVLMDDVVKAIDQMAYENNTSRSNLINQILAEKVMLITPEMRMRDIFDKSFVPIVQRVSSYALVLLLQMLEIILRLD